MFEIDRTVLLLIDVQGRLAEMMHDRDELFKSLQNLLKAVKILDIPVIWMEQIPEKLGRTTPEIAEIIEGTKGQAPIAKETFSALLNPEFAERFEALGRDQVLLTGIESHICVYQTGRDIIQRGCEVQIVTDCVSSRTRANKELGIQRILDAGGLATSCEMILFELMKVARGEAFREIVKIIKIKIFQ